MCESLAFGPHPPPSLNYSRVSSFLVLLLEFRDVAQVTQVISIIPLIRLRIEIETTVIKVGDRPPLLLIFIVEVPSHDALSATAASRDLREPELVVVGVTIRSAQAIQHAHHGR